MQSETQQHSSQNMADQVDLTLDSDDEALQAAIRASLSGSGGGGGASSGGSSRTNGNNIGAGTSKRPSTDSSGQERLGNGKRPRSCEEPFAKPPLFRLLSTSPSDRARTGSVALEDLLSGQFSSALLCNYMVDMGLLVNAQPRLLSVPVVVVHGDKPGS